MNFCPRISSSPKVNGQINYSSQVSEESSFAYDWLTLLYPQRQHQAGLKHNQIFDTPPSLDETHKMWIRLTDSLLNKLPCLPWLSDIRLAGWKERESWTESGRSNTYTISRSNLQKQHDTYHMCNAGKQYPTTVTAQNAKKLAWSSIPQKQTWYALTWRIMLWWINLSTSRITPR